MVNEPKYDREPDRDGRISRVDNEYNAKDMNGAIWISRNSKSSKTTSI